MTDDRIPTSVPDDHVSAEELSALVDGELDGGRLMAVLDHLGACPRCIERRADLERVRALVGGLENPAPAGARDAAVAAALEAVLADRDGEASRAEVPVDGAAASRWRRHRLAGIAAAVVLVAGVASGLGVALSSSGPSRPAAAPTVVTTTVPSGGSPGERGPSLHRHAGGPVVAELLPADVSSLKLVHLRGGGEGLIVTLRPGRASVVDDIGTGAVIEVGSTVLGSVHALGPDRIEISGLRPSAAAELRSELTG